MKKTAIVSCYFQKNYGSMLQAYATQKALDKLGYENETIDVSGFNHEIKKAKLLYFAKASLTSDAFFKKIGMVRNVLMKKLLKNNYSKLAAVRAQKFEQFANQHFRLSDTTPSKNALADKCKTDYDTVLVGSDQLWLPANIIADYYTLGFVPKEKNTIAYATSFGVATLPKDAAKKAAFFLKNIRYIAVREASGQALIKEIAQREVPVVCDPTLLFTGEEWLEIQPQTPNTREPYILCCFLGATPVHRAFATRLKRETGCKIVALVHLDEYVKGDDAYADETPYDVDPADFLSLIRNATYVCTDSFHCSVFSILYHKPFFSFHRYAGDTKQSTNSRLDTLFALTGIEGRLMQGDEDVSQCLALDIDYAMVDVNLEKERAASYQYLAAALENKE